MKLLRMCALGLCVLLSPSLGLAYESQVGLTGLVQYDQQKAYNGYTLVTPNTSKFTLLIDMKGNLVHKWESKYTAGLHAIILPNGNLLRAGKLPDQPVAIGGTGGIIEELDWNSNVVWKYAMMDQNMVQHHTFDRLPNGNTIILAWERKTNAEMKAKGRTKNFVPEEGVSAFGKITKDFWVDFIREVNPKGETVWEWHVLDHVGTGPDQIDINYVVPNPVGMDYATADWSHFNTCFYDAKNDKIITNSRNIAEVYFIDHKTGKIEYRWGNPSAYGKGKAPSYYDNQDQILFGSHAASVLENGNIIVFNNGSESPERRNSSIIEVDPKTEKIVWRYDPPMTHGFFSDRQGAVQKLPNGNYFVTSSNSGHMLEITPNKEVVWEYINPVVGDKVVPVLRDSSHSRPGFHDTLLNTVHRAYRYSADYPAFQGKDLNKSLPFMQNAPNMYELFVKGDAASHKFESGIK